jgi:hypothetical protein
MAGDATPDKADATALAATAPARTWEKITLFAFGTFFLIVLLIISWFDRQPSISSWFIYICVLAMAAGGVAALLPGAINVDISPGIRGGGALAIAVLVFYFGKDRVTAAPIVQVVEGLTSHLDFPTPVNPQQSDVYVYINSSLAARDCVTGAPDFTGTPNNQASIQRGSGGIQVNYAKVKQGDNIWVATKDQSGNWWKSDDLIVPQGELSMNSVALVAVKSRVENAP